MTSNSFLWSRRMTTANMSFSPPKLTPLSISSSFSSSRKSSFDEVKSNYSNPTTAPSSPFLYTPTEMAGILLGDSPTSAIKRCQDSKEECMRIQNQFNPFLNSPSSDSFKVLQYGNDSKRLSELDVEIDMASLATEVALRTLESEDEEDFLEANTSKRDSYDTKESSQAIWQPKMRLLPFLPSLPHETMLASNEAEQSPLMSKSDGHGVLPITSMNEEEQEAAPKPFRKGRARMSQEKRRRLARRREREALLLGLPSSRPASAPAQQTTFSLEELNKTMSSKNNQTVWKRNLSLNPSNGSNSSSSKCVASTAQPFPLPPHPYRHEFQKRRNSLITPHSGISYSQCLTTSSA